MRHDAEDFARLTANLIAGIIVGIVVSPIALGLLIRDLYKDCKEYVAKNK